MQRTRIAVIGAGWYARLANIPSLLDYDGADLVAICDTDENRARETATEFGIPRYFTDPAQLLHSGIADGVVVAVPHTVHYPVCRAALDAGLHALVEKPMTVTAADAWDLVRRAERADRHLMVGQTFHFTSVAGRVRAAMPRLGELLQVVGTFASHTERLFRGGSALPDGRGGTYADPKLAGGGQGHAQLSHLLGVVCWTTGLRAAEVFGYLDNRGLAVDLVDSINVRFAGGAQGSFTGTGTVPRDHPARENIVYYGTKGMLVYDLAAACAEVRLAGAETEHIGLSEGESPYPLGAPARAFVDLVAGRIDDTPGPATPAAYSVELLDAAYRSSASGRPVAVTDTTKSGVG